jgi:hypothetical protein
MAGALFLPRNIKLGQIRRTVGLLPPEEWRTLDQDGRAAVDALSLQIWFRGRQKEHAAFEDEDCVFLTVGWMQQLLRAAGARKTGEKAAAAAIALLEERRLMVDTGKTKKPKRRSESIARAEKFQRTGAIAREGGKDAQPTSQRSYWWRVFRVPALTRVLASIPFGAYWGLEDIPHRTACLSALLRCQGVISGPRRRSRPNPGSVQWVFAHSGPP